MAVAFQSAMDQGIGAPSMGEADEDRLPASPWAVFKLMSPPPDTYMGEPLPYSRQVFRAVGGHPEH
eukprot:9874711-Karenia_brevis.AAC.1